MKKLKNLSYAVAAFVITSAATSCKKSFLDEENPHSSTAENMWNSPTGFLTLVNSAYQELHEFYGIQDGTFLLETGTDLWYSAGRSGYAKEMVYYSNLQSNKSEIGKIWASCYKSINLCNAGINRIDQAGFSATEKAQRLGELRFLRAIYNYHLVEQFGGVTLYLQETAAGGVNLSPVRSTPEQFYDAIIADLLWAKDNLPVSWPTNEYTRASKKSAMGLLAKAYLQRAYYSTGAEFTEWITKAKDAAMEVINGQNALGLQLYASVDEVGQSTYGDIGTKAKNKELMFGLSFDLNAGTANYLAQANGNRIFKYFLTKYTGRAGMVSAFVPEYGADGESRIMPTWHLLDLYDEKVDARYKSWFQEVWIANQNYTWKIGDTSAPLGKKPSIVGKFLAAGDTAQWCTKGFVGFDKDTARYLVAGSNQLYINPVHGQGANIVDADKLSQTTTNFYPSFRKFVNMKRPASQTTAPDFGDATIIRLSDIYLVAAEAYLQLGDKTNAAKYINAIRERATLPGLPKTDMDITPAQVDIYFILDERGRELAGELHRWYDLKRVFHGSDWVAYIQKYNPDMTLIQPFHRVRPIPSTELNVIDNAKDYGANEGYVQPQ